MFICILWTMSRHLMDFELESGTVEIEPMDSLSQHFPKNNETFIYTAIDYADLDKEIHETE